ncbi:bifunctional 2-polyprenyl-6-hydroxyphenol methylase/3-demethylubiquinol 3-O-methyltransferase UbiG [Rhodococcus sp. 1168]|uniref:class I SAM-dependent methyltransferase n=1 Tax=Rhodococcus sp. 1168 TaxID=2018041 RepID=UPI000A0BFD78|nr:class I SAM-dependent methyltransferase [Rhodococcus sp. 1168]ORI20556.1 SAM-dependent methyltransferase [Rhodococcus sp. 1168]
MNSADDQRLATESINQGDPTGWFDKLYREAADGNAVVPWHRVEPNPLIVEWAQSRAGDRRAALVGGCGYGTDAEFIASLGYETTAFDVSPTAIDAARRRFPQSAVNYEVADVLAMPTQWRGTFDVVIESITVQSMPLWVRSDAIAAIASTVSAGGTLLVVSGIREEGVDVDGPPWPLTRTEIESFSSHGLTTSEIELVTAENRWRATFVNLQGNTTGN